MCPNCVLNQAALGTGIYVAFGICALFFVIGVAAVWFAFKNGEFEDLEGVKFDMLDDGDETELAAKARAAVEKLRTQST